MNNDIKTSQENNINEDKFKKFFLGIVLAVFLQIVATSLAFYYLNASLKVSILIGLVALLVTLWTNKALPMGVVSLSPIILFPLFGILDTKSAASNYANPICYLFLGGFMIAAATEKIGLHRIVARTFLSRFPKTPKGVISALGLASVILGMALSNSTVALLLLPVAMTISEDNFLRTRFLLAIAFGASISGITTPIGSPPNLIYLGFLESNGLEKISFMNWIVMMFPLTAFMLFVMVKILSFNTKEYKLNLVAFEEMKITNEHKKMLFFLTVLLVLLMLNSPIEPIYSGLGLNENLVLLAFGLIMFIPKVGFLDWNDSKSIPYEIIFLFGASFCIAMAFSQAELGGAFEKYFKLFNELPFVFFILLAGIFAVIATSFLSTTALIAILLPIINVSTSSFLDDSQRILVMLVITICASFSFIIPISTPPNAIVFAQGKVSAWDMFSKGFLLSLIGVIFVSFIFVWYWWFFLG